MKLLFAFILFILPVNSFASDFGLDGVIAGSSRGFSFQAHTYLFFGSRSFAIGPVIYVEETGFYNLDIIAGVGIRTGESFFLELDGGFFYRKYDQNNFKARQNGIGVILMTGFYLTKSLNVSIATKLKYFLDSSNMELNAIPLVGFSWTL